MWLDPEGSFFLSRYGCRGLSQKRKEKEAGLEHTTNARSFSACANLIRNKKATPAGSMRKKEVAGHAWQTKNYPLLAVSVPE